MKINEANLRSIYFKFFEEKGHKLISSSSLIPENDPTVLFTMAGMHPLVPFLLGEKHQSGTRLCNVQKCVRTGDIDEVGDVWHLTFFEMLGNWSLGDYFKKEAISYSYEFLTSPNYLGIEKDKLYFTCFEGDEEFPKDETSFQVWLDLGVDKSHIFYLPKDNNFWILGSGVGPCGPDSEMFYDTGKEACSSTCSPACSCGKYVEIWNDVFMEYKKTPEGKIEKLTQSNVDTGMGLERTVAILNNNKSVYDLDSFKSLRAKLEELSGKKYEENLKSFRIVMDHIRTATFILGDEKGIVPSNIGAGYVLRRLIRRSIRHLKKLNLTSVLPILAEVVIDEYATFYQELLINKDFIYQELEKEETKFNKTLKDGEGLFFKLVKHLKTNEISGEDAFKLFDTFGFPIEFTEELAKENGLIVDVEGFNEAFKKHQEKSKTIEAGSFLGGLADDSYESTKYHTLAHLILATLQKMFGSDVVQKGSNITKERLRLDFNLDHKMTEEEKKELEARVNEEISKDLVVSMEEISLAEAKNIGIKGVFEKKYADIVKVYSIGEYSREICGGPHVKKTSELGVFKLVKEESCASGVRRIKAILEEK